MHFNDLNYNLYILSPLKQIFCHYPLYGHLCTKGHIGKLIYFRLKYICNNIEENSQESLAFSGRCAHFWNNHCGQGDYNILICQAWDHSGITSNQTSSEYGGRFLFFVF